MAATFAAGRWSAPEKIKTETKIVEVEKKVSVSDKDKKEKRHKKTEKKEVTKPDGTKEVITIITDDKTSEQSYKETQVSSNEKTTDEKKEVTKSSSRTHLSALAGIDVTKPSKGLTYGLHVSREILGPISIGIFGFTNGTAGCSIGLSF